MKDLKVSLSAVFTWEYHIKLKHVGHRPSGPVKYKEDSYGVYVETLGDGTLKYWNKKTMNSGCGNVITVTNKDVKDGLIYCNYCGEMCNENQFIEEK